MLVEGPAISGEKPAKGIVEGLADGVGADTFGELLVGSR